MSSDVKGFYDEVDPLLIYRWLVAAGCPIGDAVLMLKMQCLPTISLDVASFWHHMPLRGGSLITGTNIAVAVAPIPIVDMVDHLQGSDVWSHCSFQKTLVGSVWGDNMRQ